jgi:hypothetical protein
MLSQHSTAYTNPPPNFVSCAISEAYELFLITNKVLDASRRSRTLSGGDEERRVTARERYLQEAYGAIRRKAFREPQGRTRGAIEGNAA